MASMERRIIAGIVGLVVLVAIVFGVRHVMAENARLKDELKVSRQQSENNSEAVRQTDRFHNTTTIIREKQEAATDAVQALPGAQTPVDPDRRSGLCEQLSRMRDGAAVCLDPDPAIVP